MSHRTPVIELDVHVVVRPCDVHVLADGTVMLYNARLVDGLGEGQYRDVFVRRDGSVHFGEAKPDRA